MAPDQYDTRDRVIRVEAEVDNIQATVSDMSKKVDQMYSIMMQAKGAQWLLFAAVAFIGYFAGLLAKIFPLWKV